MCRKLIILISLMFVAVCVSAQTATKYEYWLDDGYDSRQSGMFSEGNLNVEAELGDIPLGLHAFNFRAMNADGLWGSPFRRYFYSFGTTSVAKYEHWIDNDYESRQTGDWSQDSPAFEVDFSNYPMGLHSFNLRVMNDAGQWGAPFRKYVYNLTTSALVKYEYWLDNDYSSRTEGSWNAGDNTFAVDMQDMPAGLHSFNFRAMNGKGEWGAVSRNYFYNLGDSTVSRYEYWLDNDYEGRQCVDTHGYSYNFDVDVSSLDKSQPHYFNYRAMQGAGRWGSIYRKILLFLERGNRPVVGVRHSINGKDLGTIAWPVGETELAYEVPIDENLGYTLDGRTFSFAGDRVSVAINDSIAYSNALITDKGVGPFSTWTLPYDYEYSADAVAMSIPSKRTFDKPSALQFVAVKFEVGQSPVYVKASQAARFDIYRDGETVASLSGSQLLTASELSLENGTYYGVLYSVAADDTNASPSVTLVLAEEADWDENQSVKFNYNGRYLEMTSEEQGTISYSIDGGEYTAYSGTPVDLGKPATVTARVAKTDGTQTGVTEFVATGYADDESVATTVEGIIGECCAWTDRDDLDRRNRLRVKGAIGASDYEWLRGLKGMRHLDLSEVATAAIPDGALASMPLMSVSLPAALTTVGSAPLTGNNDLGSVIWNSTASVPASLLEGVGNPNLLLYVENAALASDITGRNIVAGGSAGSISLVDGEPFYSAVEFTASEISYSRDFTKVTALDGECAGWETIALPFEAAAVTHAKGELKPFALNPEGEELRYWLYRPIATGWEAASKIEANVPYLIAMPNSEEYYDAFNVAGKVTFSTPNAYVAATPESTEFDFREGMKLTPNYSKLPASAFCYVVNDERIDDGSNVYMPGSQFVPGARAVRPFEAYLSTPVQTSRVAIFRSSDVEEIMGDMKFRVWAEGSVLCIESGFSARIPVYDVAGRIVATADVKAGEICRVDGLAPGIYLVGRKNKVNIR